MTILARTLFASAAAVALSAGAAQAQDDVAQVAEVVVTAQKRAENLQDVPISMEVVSSQKLEAFHSTDIKSIMNYVPNVFVQSTAGNDVIYIRGFGSPPANFAFDQSVSMYVDGVYAGRARQFQSPFFDLERVEVLRGPQGALFGKNTPAGAVSVVSANPTSQFEGAVTGAYNFEMKGFDVWGYVSGPITETLSARLALKFLDQDGYIKNLYDGKDEPSDQQALARLTLRWTPTDSFDYTAKLDYGNREREGGLSVSSPLTTSQQPRTTRYIKDQVLGPEGTEATSLNISGTGNLSLGEFTLTSVTGYSFFKSNIINGFDQTTPTGGVTPNSVFNSFPEHFRQMSQEVRLLSPEGERLEYIVGAYYDQSLYRLTQLGGFDIAALNYFGVEQTDFRQRAETFSVFGQATLNATDAFRVIGSLRYTETKKRGHFTGHMIVGPFPLRPLTTANGRISEDNIDPSITVQYDVTPDIMVYATYGRGSKSGGFVGNTYGTTDATFTFRPEKSENYEAGVKSTLLDGRMILNASVYNTKFKNLQVSVYNPARSSYETGNAASASAKGIEGSMVVYPLPGFDVSASASYQNVEYDDYPGASCLATQPLSECNPTIPASVAANNIAGSPLPYTSKFTGNIQLHHQADLPNELKLDTTVVVAGRSKYFNSDNQSPLFGLQKGYAKLDARIQVGPSDSRWHVALVGTNLTNEKTTGSAFNLPAPITAAPRAIMYLEPTRSVSIEAGLRF